MARLSTKYANKIIPFLVIFFIANISFALGRGTSSACETRNILDVKQFLFFNNYFVNKIRSTINRLKLTTLSDQQVLDNINNLPLGLGDDQLTDLNMISPEIKNPFEIADVLAIINSLQVLRFDNQTYYAVTESTLDKNADLIKKLECQDKKSIRFTIKLSCDFNQFEIQTGCENLQ